MTDVYRDTDERYQRDPAFHAAVKTLESIAREHSFTPGELKQIAFKAALNIEMKAVPALRCIVHDLEGGPCCVRCGFRPQLAIVGPDTVGPAQDDTPARLGVLVRTAARLSEAIVKTGERRVAEYEAAQAEIDRRVAAGESVYDRPLIHRGESVAGQYEASEDPE